MKRQYAEGKHAATSMRQICIVMKEAPFPETSVFHPMIRQANLNLSDKFQTRKILRVKTLTDRRGGFSAESVPRRATWKSGIILIKNHFALIFFQSRLQPDEMIPKSSEPFR